MPKFDFWFWKRPLCHLGHNQCPLFLFKMGQPCPLIHFFCLFKLTLQILEQIGLLKDVHPVYCAVIRTHDLDLEERESPPITSRPGHPPITFFLIKQHKDTAKVEKTSLEIY